MRASKLLAWGAVLGLVLAGPPEALAANPKAPKSGSAAAPGTTLAPVSLGPASLPAAGASLSSPSLPDLALSVSPTLAPGAIAGPQTAAPSPSLTEAAKPLEISVEIKTDEKGVPTKAISGVQELGQQISKEGAGSAATQKTLEKAYAGPATAAEAPREAAAAEQPAVTAQVPTKPRRHRSKKSGVMPGYNEAVDESGQLRPAYKAFEERSGMDPLNPPHKLVHAMAGSHPLGDKISILPVPLVLSRQEYETKVRAGAEQRLRGLMAFFWDMVHGEQQILFNENRRASHAVPREITTDLIEYVFRDEGWNLNAMYGVWRRTRPSDLSVVYGPDVVRNPKGDWVVLEDNVSDGMHMGGAADLGAIQRVFTKAAKVPVGPAPEPGFFETVIRRFLAKHGLDVQRGGVAALMRGHGELNAIKPIERLHKDMESLRELKILKSLGVKVLDPDTLSRVEKRRVFDGQYRAILNIDDPGDPIERERFYRNLFQTGKAALLSAPGTSALGSKALLPYVETFIRFYLGEEPILKTQPTGLLGKESLGTLSERTGSQLNAAWVVKRASGLQGSEVFILDRMTSMHQKTLFEAIQRQASLASFSGKPQPLYVVQQRVDPSYIPAARTPSWINYYVDLRPLTMAFGIGDIYTTPVPWGRSIPTVGTGLNNVSQGAYELVVILED